MRRAWSLLTVLNRQHGGNEGYDDKSDTCYSYDSTVPSARGVASGDLAVVRDSSQVLGVAVISDVSTRSGTKKRRRCPDCQTTGFKARSTKLPRYRCYKGHEFDEPTEELVPVDFFQAYYADTWMPGPMRLSANALEHLMISGAPQHSIRELSIERLRDTFGDKIPQAIWDTVITSGHGP